MGQNKTYVALLNLLREKQAGDIVTKAELKAATNWSETSYRTYVSKNKFSSFLDNKSEDAFTLRRHGNELTIDDIKSSFSQKNPQEQALETGLRLNGEKADYCLVRRIGAGAVGEVWEATTSSLFIDNQVALKILKPRPDLLEPSKFRDVSERFRRECRNTRHLEHAHLIRHLDHGQFNNKPFLIMQLANKSVSDLISEKKRLSLRKSIEIVLNCIQALKHLHTHRCVHRDVKPANILLVEDRYVLGDLGIVRWDELNKAFTDAGTITHASLVLGSFYYMPPEQGSDPHAAVQASDIYSLGISWYEMLTGERPLPQTVAAQKCNNPSSNESVNSLFKRMVAYEHADRIPLVELEKELSFIHNLPN